MPSRNRPSWPWLVKGSSATSSTTPTSGTAALIARGARPTRLSGSRSAGPAFASALGRSGRSPAPGRPARRALRRPHRQVKGEPCDAGDRGDRLLGSAVEHEDRPDQIGGRHRFSCTRVRDQSALRIRRRRRPGGDLRRCCAGSPQACGRLILFMSGHLHARGLHAVRRMVNGEWLVQSRCPTHARSTTSPLTTRATAPLAVLLRGEQASEDGWISAAATRSASSGSG